MIIDNYVLAIIYFSNLNINNAYQHIRMSCIKCGKCNGKTTKHICDDYGSSGYIGRTSIPIISIDEEQTYHICKKCIAYHLECIECNQLCRFVGDSGHEKDECFVRAPKLSKIPNKFRSMLKEWMTENNESMNIEIMLTPTIYNTDMNRMFEDDDSTIDNAAYPYYYVGDKGLAYISGLDWKCVTGPDGGFSHSWICDQCDKVYQGYDK